MSIRWKLLILLLAIALVPLVVVAGRGNRATAQLGRVTGDQARKSLTHLARQQLLQLVSDKATIVGNAGSIISLAVQIQASAVERCLAEPAPRAHEIYMSEDFDGRRPPSDLAPSSRHWKMGKAGAMAPMLVSASESVFKLAPGVDRDVVGPDMLRLAAVVPTYRALQDKYGELLYWQFTSLDKGVHNCYPGHGGYPAEFDSRQQRWYIRGKAGKDVVWTPPYMDTSSQRAVLTATMPVRWPDGTLAGVTGVDITVSALLDRAQLPEFGSSVAKVIILEPRDNWDINKPRELDLQAYTADQLGMAVVAEPAEDESEKHWKSPVDRTWLEPDDPACSLEIRRDLYAGRADVREVNYRGETTLWAYSPVLGKRTNLIVMVPSSAVLADAVRAQESIRALTRSQLRLTAIVFGLVSLIVVIIALTGSRTVIQPVLRLATAARQVAAGHFETRVRVKTRDELGELGHAFNEMVPQLEDRMRIRQSLSLAMEVQQNLLPSSAPQMEGLDVAGRSVYCDETGGDYYDFIDLSEISPRELGLAVGDVTGHGVAAALLMTTARALLRSRAGQPNTLSELMRGINRLLAHDTPSGRFMTLFYAVIDARGRTIRWANAGHDPAITYDPQADSFGELQGGDLPLGIEPEEEYREFHRDGLNPGTVIVIGTDGIWEAHNTAHQQFGKDALREVIRSNATKSARQIAAAVTEAVDAFRGAVPQEDDVALVVVKII